jgi:N-glycosylase/DNA lyase
MSYRFSDIFYIDATNQQTLEADLVAITPTDVKQSVDACKHWLATKHSQNWLLFFDNADDVQLNFAKFFPKCRFGNILITTRNPQLSTHADQGADAKVADMNPEDAKKLLMHMSRAEKTDDNDKLAAIIVKVLFVFCDICIQANC